MRSEKKRIRFLIVCDNVQPYADGQKLTFRIGNPNFVTFSVFKLQAKWGRAAPTYPGQSQQPNAYETWIAQNAQWQRSLHEKEIDSVAVLRPGVWNTVDVILSPAKAEDLRYLAASMTTDQIALLRDKPK